MTASRSRFRLVVIAGVAALAGSVLLSASVGAAGLSPSAVFWAGLSLLDPDWAPAGSYPVWAPELLSDLRLPRIALALVAGGALATAGATFQGIFRNPLAEPFLLGISAGAAVGAAIAIVWDPLAALGTYGLPLMAFLGAVFAAFLVYRLATFSGETSSASLLLSGVAVGSTFTALMTFFLLLDQQNMHTLIVWHLGGMSAASWSKILLAGLVVSVGFLYMLANADRLNLLLMGPDRAQELGIDAHATRRNLLVAGALTTGAAVAFTGLIGFVGLMVPHIVRLLLGPDHRRLLPATALFGTVFLLLCDTVARTAFAPMELPVGIITAFIGGPFFLYLLRHRRGI